MGGMRLTKLLSAVVAIALTGCGATSVRTVVTLTKTVSTPVKSTPAATPPCQFVGGGLRFEVTIRKGRVGCGAAVSVLQAFVSGQGELHGPRSGPSSAQSWTLFGWSCGRGAGGGACIRHGSNFRNARDFIVAEVTGSGNTGTGNTGSGRGNTGNTGSTTNAGDVGSEKAAILSAAPGGSYPPGWAHLTVRVSTIDPRWAAVFIEPNPGYERQVQPDVASMYHTDRGWVVHQTGNGGGCGVPAGVRAELQLNCY